jgi:hypothetical protein
MLHHPMFFRSLFCNVYCTLPATFSHVLSPGSDEEGSMLVMLTFIGNTPYSDIIPLRGSIVKLALSMPLVIISSSALCHRDSVDMCILPQAPCI